MQVLDLDPVRRGVGLWNGVEWRFGREALGACRLDPQKISPDHWESLSLQPLIPVRGGMRHRADLAVAALKAEGLSPETPLAVLVPSAWDKETLRVFLGVAKECALNVRWLFPRAVAAVSQVAPDTERGTIWEWSWNQLYEVHLKKEEGRWKRRDVRAVPEGGIFAWFRRDAVIARDLALDRLRYDPLYSGVTEEALFDSWWAWLHGAQNWSLITADGSELRLDVEKTLFEKPHRVWAEKHGLRDEKDNLLPAPLRHLLGFDKAGIVPGDIRIEVPDHDQASARWRETLPEDTGERGPPPLPKSASKSASKPVTHVVVHGIARPCDGPWTGPERPGDTVKLPDGETGLAIHVPADPRKPELNDDSPAAPIVLLVE
ncbi:MAG: hypothetical protein JJU29_14935 [Verrucomicrobia bacterium]|nr:hypothetical protein [Verrucomicrobiota bacterium]MCH8513282.1 hypothetical protein [Kiritimatiellia bacterium]